MTELEELAEAIYHVRMKLLGFKNYALWDDLQPPDRVMYLECAVIIDNFQKQFVKR